MHISNINNKKSSGFDLVSNFLIKKFPDTTLKLLAVIFNNCINNGYFPKEWKIAKILPIRKKQNHNNPEDFRPISLLSNVGKLFELVLKEKLENEFITEPISDFQFGFKRAHSTNHALLKFHNDVVQNLRKKTSTVAISLDIEKAFDSVYQNGILHKIIDLGVDPFLIKLLRSFFSNRRFGVSINNVTSALGPVKSGVPQGSVLAPLLFNLFLHDFPHQSGNSKAILYADDCLIYAHNISPISALNAAALHLGHISVFYRKWGIKINAAKSEAICIRNPSGKCARFVVPESKELNLSLDGVNIPFKNSITYLGIKFDKLLKFNVHVRNQLKKTKQITGMFANLFNSVYIPKNTKLLLYKVAIRSVLYYGFPIWFTISPIVAKELEIHERNILRKCIGKNYESVVKRFSNSYVYKNADVVPFCRYALSLLEKFVLKLSDLDNDLINEIYEIEKHINWNGSAYLSSIGIINEHLDNDPESHNVPFFYMKSNPGIHRG